jgi:hypothetical protein
MTRAQTPIRIACYRRSFIVDNQPHPLATGWVLRERHGDGQPTMAGPYQSAADAVGYIDELIAAGPLRLTGLGLVGCRNLGNQAVHSVGVQRNC